MKKKILIFIVLLMLGVLLSIPKVYALEPMSTFYFRSNNALTMVSNTQNTNGTLIKYQTDQSYVYKTIISTNNYYDPFVVVLSDLDLYSDLSGHLTSNTAIPNVINDLYQNYDYLDMDVIYFTEYSDDDDRTKLLFPLTQYGGQNYVYLYTKEQISYASSSMFIISEASYNQYMEFLLSSNQQYQAGYDYGLEVGHKNGYNQGKNDYGLRGGVLGNANYWFSQGQLSELDLWGSLLSAFFGVFAVLSIEILPGIQLGYFVGFFLVLGVAGMIIGSFMIRRR